MSEVTTFKPTIEQIEDVLRGELAHGDTILASARPVLTHLLASGDQTSFSDEVIARIRGMANDCASQLLRALQLDWQAERDGQFDDAAQADLAGTLLRDTAFLSHAHALTLEALLAEKFQKRSGIDPVLSPLIQEMAASSDDNIAALSIHVMAAQARFIQQQRRMELPLSELPGDLFYKAMLTLQGLGGVPEDVGAATQARLRTTFDEGSRRIGQITRLIMALERKASRALSLDHAGLAIFATALAMASAQDRDLAVLSLSEHQLARLALSMRSAGLSQSALEEQFLFLHPDITLPEGFEGMSSQRAAKILEASSVQAGR